MNKRKLENKLEMLKGNLQFHRQMGNHGMAATIETRIKKLEEKIAKL